MKPQDGDTPMDGRPYLMLDKLFQGFTDGDWARVVHAAAFPQAAMPSIDVNTSVDAATSLRDMLQ